MRIPLPSVQQDPRPSGQFTARSVVPQQDATGQNLAAIGQGAQQLGDQVSGVADFLQDQLDHAKFTEASNLTSDARRETMLGEGGYLRLIGVNATGGSRKKAFDAFDKKVEGIEKTLTNDVQRARWKRKLAEQRERAMVDADNHEVTQTHNYLKGVETASIASNRIDGDFPGMMAAVDNVSKMNGEVPGEAPHNLRRLDATTQWHEQNIPLLAQTDPQMAATKLDEAVAAKEIDPEKIAGLRSVVRHSSIAAKTTEFMFFAEGNAQKRGGTLIEQQVFAEATADASFKGGKLNADEFKMAQSMIRDRYHNRRNLQAGATNDAIIKAEKFLRANKSLGMAGLDPKLLAQLDDAGATEQIKRFADNDRWTTNPGAELEFEAMTIEDYKNMPQEEFLLRARMNLNNSDMGDAIRRRKAVLGSDRDRSEAKSDITRAERIKHLARTQLNLEGRDLGKDEEAAAIDDFRFALDARWVAYQKDNKVPPTDENFATFVKTEERAIVINNEGKSVSLMSLPAKDQADPKVMFNGVPTRNSALPIRLVRNDGTSISRSDMAKILAQELKRTPTPQEVATHIEMLAKADGLSVEFGPAKADATVYGKFQTYANSVLGR